MTQDDGEKNGMPSKPTGTPMTQNDGKNVDIVEDRNVVVVDCDNGLFMMDECKRILNKRIEERKQADSQRVQKVNNDLEEQNEASGTSWSGGANSSGTQQDSGGSTKRKATSSDGA